MHLIRRSKISIHTPHTRCDSERNSHGIISPQISIHTPHTRCDAVDSIVLNDYCNFNPHTSYEVWPDSVINIWFIMNFNPHTSYEVWLLPMIRARCLPLYFNPHTSYEVWLKSVLGRIVAFVISIHTPHTRCDRFRSLAFQLAVWFQSTHLIRGVTAVFKLFKSTLVYFNPHTSYEVWHEALLDFAISVGISIHTPHTRCDYFYPDYLRQPLANFNPHTSYEVWPGRTRAAILFQIGGFQSTHLIRGVTRDVCWIRRPPAGYFNPHTSYEVWPIKSWKRLRVLYFNPHTSYEVWHLIYRDRRT